MKQTQTHFNFFQLNRSLSCPCKGFYLKTFLKSMTPIQNPYPTLSYQYISHKLSNQSYKKVNSIYYIEMDNHNVRETFQQIYKSGVRGSYFGGMKNPKFQEKSKLQLQKMEDEEKQVDQKTFRLVRNFKRPEDDFIVKKHSGKCHLDKEGLFSCFGKRKMYDINLKNSKLIVSYHDQIARYFNFEAVSTNIDPSGQSFVIQIEGLKEGVYIQPQTREKGEEKKVTKEWVEVLKNMIQQTNGKKKRYTYLPRHCQEFYKSEHILNDQFQRCANSGDILLFKSPHSAARLQRMFTDSQYDHVGIVLRNSKNQIYVYESTSTEGVGLTPWAHMIKYEWYDQTDKICWRPLNMKMSDRDIDTIEAYVVKTLGKGFELNLDKLFQFKSKLKRTQEQEQNKTYFCSELAARLYKQLGIIDEQKSSTMYFPVDFSQKGGIKIVREGVSLGNQKIISFDGIR